MTRLEACHDSLGDALPYLHVLWGVITFPAGFYNYPMDKDFIARKLLSYLQPLPKLLTLWHFVIVIVASYTVVDLSRKPDSKQLPQTLKSFLEIAQKTIINGSLEVWDSSSLFHILEFVNLRQNALLRIFRLQITAPSAFNWS
jgi:hypothetical protein